MAQTGIKRFQQMLTKLNFIINQDNPTSPPYHKPISQISKSN